MGEAEVDESLEVDGGRPVGKPDLVACDTAVGHSAAGSDEPGQAPFDHGPPAAVVVGEVAVAPGPAGFGQFGVVGRESETAAILAGGALGLEGTALASPPEGVGIPPFRGGMVYEE